MPSLAPFTSTQVSVDETLTLAFPDSVIKYTMTLDMPGDTALANNNTNTFTTTTTASTLPPVRSLVSNDQNSVDIVWQAPDLDLLPAGQRLETFENYDFWQGANLGDWTNIDGDQLNVKGFVSNGQTMPVTGQQGYFIYDCDSLSNIYGISRPGTGHRSLSTLYTVGGESRPVTIDINSGVSAIDNALIDVTADYGRILVSVPSDMTCHVYTLQGNIVSEPHLSAGANSIELQAGVYILTLNGRAYKLAVK